MSRKINIINKGYYDENEVLYKKKSIEIKPGITVLAGCNGIGKTTLLHQIESFLKKENIPCLMFDNLHDGGQNSISYHASLDDFATMSTLMCSSEGESIYINISNLAARLGNFVKTGDNSKNDKYEKLARAIESLVNEEKEPKKEVKIPDERWILLDAIDSGFSVDNIVDLKEDLFKTILKYNFGNEIYIIVSANEYELCRGEQCFDVYNGKYTTFKDYEDYRDFILKSREGKEKRNRGKID